MTDWTFLTDDEWTPEIEAAVDSLVTACENMGGGAATSTGLSDDDRLLTVVSIAHINDRWVANTRQDEDAPWVWAWRPDGEPAGGTRYEVRCADGRSHGYAPSTAEEARGDVAGLDARPGSCGPHTAIEITTTTHERGL